jgi:hypothetical protein
MAHPPWTAAEDQVLLAKVLELGPCWTTIARHLGTRTDIEAKNRWLLIYNDAYPLAPKIGRPLLFPRLEKENVADPTNAEVPRKGKTVQTMESITLPRDVQDWFVQMVDLNKSCSTV